VAGAVVDLLEVVEVDEEEGRGEAALGAARRRTRSSSTTGGSGGR
jgi:hypothetical protein